MLLTTQTGVEHICPSLLDFVRKELIEIIEKKKKVIIKMIPFSLPNIRPLLNLASSSVLYDSKTKVGRRD